LARTLRSQGEKRLGSFFRLRAKLDNFSELLFWSPPAWFPSIRSSLSIDSGLPCITVRSTPAIVFSGPAQRSLMLWPARSPSRLATLYIESSDSFVASAAASIATGWSESVPGRELHPLKSSAFSRALLSQQLTGPCRHGSSYGPTDQTCKQRIGVRQCSILSAIQV
jgi:hypothetical protein